MKLTFKHSILGGFLGASILAAIAASTYSVSVNSSGVITYPLNFAAANGLGGSSGTNGSFYNLTATNQVNIGTILNVGLIMQGVFIGTSNAASLPYILLGDNSMSTWPTEIVPTDAGGIKVQSTTGTAREIIVSDITATSLTTSNASIAADGLGAFQRFLLNANSSGFNDDGGDGFTIDDSNGSAYESDGVNDYLYRPVYGANTTTPVQIGTAGISTTTSNLLAPSSISFPNTTVNWTNTTGRSLFVFINNSAVTGTAIKINGATVFTVTTGDATIPLQPGEYFSETYTIGTPTATIKPY